MHPRNKHLKLPASFRKKPTLGAAGMVGTSLALGISSAVLLPAPALAVEETVELETVKVEDTVIDPNPNAEPGVPYKAVLSGDARHVKPLAETPQTITVLTQQQMQDSGRSDLRDVLRTQPGITLGTGENGNAFGDRYIIRGQEARSDVFVDGLRDPGMTVRESFALDQVEITKGPSATFAGRGATGGAVNGITKQATTDTDFTKLGAGLGMDDYRRFTLDSNVVLTDNAAVRVNLLHAYQEVPDREPADRRRNGAALSFNLKPTDKLDLAADYYHLDAEDSPDLGAYINRTSGKVVELPVYTQHGDFLKSNVDTYTLRLGYQATDDLRVTNLTRYGTTDNGYVTTGARPGTDPGTLNLSTHWGWQEVEYFANQLNFYLNRNIGGMLHQFILGTEYSDHKVLNGNYEINGSSSRPSASGVAYADLEGALARNVSKGGWDIDWQTETLSLYLMDTVDVTDKWTLFGGLRHDRIDFQTVTGTTARTKYTLKDGLWNGHLGVSYKFIPHANVYASWSTASDVNGGESDVTSCDYGGLCIPSSGPGGDYTPEQRQALFSRSKPEKSENLEIGTKWNLMSGKLLATAAAFQVTKRDVMEVARGASYTNIGSINTGKYRVEGVEFGLSGMLAAKLMAQAGLALMNAKILDSQAEANEGETLSNFADKSASVLLSYQATPKLTIGGGATYNSERYAGTPESVAAEDLKVPSYTVYDLFAAYKFDQHWKARLNINNVTDKDYYLTTYRSGAFTYKGDARNAYLTLSYDF